MTNITELAQSLKAAAIDAKELAIIARYSKGRAAAEKFYALANPNNVLALVEALEKAQQVGEELCKLLPPGVEYMDPPDGGDVTPLEGVRRMVADYRQRIAELESNTVKLPTERFCPAEYAGSQLWSETEVWNKAITTCADALRAAGIKVEAE
ncbi:TPA: hypothetical protein MYM09_003567 [Klebsiella pneumoniae]|uniref:hypothetical protein n=1 Tax=Klebsiella pneumoniae TaxID=573 RepID=UPI000E2B626E|nr:hypothetical protein [Klebsiella pneumoniae]HBQ5768355.1 hypothetical protein [Klebsiella pneumoniae subsp. pneumoniae]HCI6284314.1 hypothetical protein [Klebsiella quasipneumoniae subsp. similipneumoniae]MCD5759110.1 hypothetical protein [Klebsiella pneumoniae]MEE2428044.1 hypothetical protein [Klebsiella pneumoniae]UGM84250.1 hypothetical protein K9F41_14795 [Klebsiella pneumoniae]